MLECKIFKDGFNDDVSVSQLVVIGGGNQTGHPLLALNARNFLSLHLLINTDLNKYKTCYFYLYSKTPKTGRPKSGYKIVADIFCLARSFYMKNINICNDLV